MGIEAACAKLGGELLQRCDVCFMCFYSHCSTVPMCDYRRKEGMVGAPGAQSGAVGGREVGAMPAGDWAEPGARLRAERRKRGLTKPELARRLVPHVTEQCPSLDTLISY